MIEKAWYKIPLMPIGNVNRVRRISTELMTAYKGKFGVDFKQNKKMLDEVAIVRSKGLKNEIAGYIATHLKRELEEQKEKESRVPQEEPILAIEKMEEQLVS
jgi:small subunit ribosomal protein S17e